MKVYQTVEFRRWLRKLSDEKAKARILSRLTAVATVGHLGDWKPIGSGLVELRVHSGPGYRIYCAKRARNLLVVLLGGTKDSQSRDIRRAKRIALTAELPNEQS